MNVTASREQGLCFTADCNELPSGQHYVYCPEFWRPLHPSPSVAHLHALGTPPAPSSLRNLLSPLLNDILRYIRADPMRFLQQLDDVQLQRRNNLPFANFDNARQWYQQVVQQTERHSQLNVTSDDLDATQGQVHHTESTQLPWWNPPDPHLDHSDYAAWHRQLSQRLQEQQQSYISYDEMRPTIMGADQHYASLVQQGYETRSSRSSRNETQQPRRPSSSVNNTFGSLHTRPRQAVEWADAVERGMGARRAGRNNGRRRWFPVRSGSGRAVLR